MLPDPRLLGVGCSTMPLLTWLHSEHLKRVHSLKYVCRSCTYSYTVVPEKHLRTLKREHEAACEPGRRLESGTRPASGPVRMTETQDKSWKKWRKQEVQPIAGESPAARRWRKIYKCIFPEDKGHTEQTAPLVPQDDETDGNNPHAGDHRGGNVSNNNSDFIGDWGWQWLDSQSSTSRERQGYGYTHGEDADDGELQSGPFYFPALEPSLQRQAQTYGGYRVSIPSSHSHTPSMGYYQTSSLTSGGGGGGGVVTNARIMQSSDDTELAPAKYEDTGIDSVVDYASQNDALRGVGSRTGDEFGGTLPWAYQTDHQGYLDGQPMVEDSKWRG